MQQEKAVKAPVLAKLANVSSLVQILVILILAAMPFITGRTLQNLLITIFLMGVFAMSYDILLGYTGVISFGHAMFFGIGAYCISIIITRTKPTLGYLLLAILIALVISSILSVFVGFLSLRVKNTYYAMITLAFGEIGVIIAEKARNITNGYDGMSFTIPDFLTNRTLFYYVALAFLVLSLVFLIKFTTSPIGRVLVAIRENEQRAKFLGYDTLRYKIISSVVAGTMASLAGAFYAMHMRFVSTDVLTATNTINAMLATIIGGAGTLFGPIIGTGITQFAGFYLSKLANVNSIFERWYIIFGLLYIIIVLFAPHGILGLVYKYRARKFVKSKKVEISR